MDPERPQINPGFGPRGKFFDGSRRSFNSCIARLLQSLAIKKYSKEVFVDFAIEFCWWVESRRFRSELAFQLFMGFVGFSTAESVFSSPGVKFHEMQDSQIMVAN